MTSTPSPCLARTKTKGRSPRIFRESRSMTLRLAPTGGARSVLSMTSKSERVMPRPTLRGILSPADADARETARDQSCRVS